MVNISLRVLSRPVAAKLPEIHQNLGPDFDEKVNTMHCASTKMLVCNVEILYGLIGKNIFCCFGLSQL